MALSNISKTHMDNLILSLTDKNHNLIDIVKRNHSDYAQLKLISKQIEMLKSEAYSIINNSKTQNELSNIDIGFKLVSGQYYYLYEKNKKKYFSLISPHEWKTKNKFLNKYYYDYDKHFVVINE